MKKKVMAKVVTNKTIEMYINSKIILFGLLLAFIFAPIVEANTLSESERPVGRQMSVLWSSIYEDGAKGKTQIDAKIADLVYTNTDTVTVGFGTMCYILSEMYPENTLYKTYGGATVRDGKVDYFLNKAHEANISVWLTIQGMALSDDPCALQYFSAYRPKTISGSILHATKLNWEEPEGRRLWREMALFMIKNHDFDGLWVEEPYMTITQSNTLAAKTALLSWGITDKLVLASHGYDPRTLYDAGTKTIPEYAITDMLHEREKLITLGFKELHDSIRALGSNYAYPKFVIAVALNMEYFSPNEPPNNIIGHRGAMWGLNITDLSKNHYIDVWQSESSPATDSVSAYVTHLKYGIDHTPEILHTTGVYITDSAMYPYVNPNFFNQVSAVQPNGGSYEAIFANVHMYRDCISAVMVNNITTCNNKLSMTPKEWLHQNKPVKPRNFNPVYSRQLQPILASISIPNSTIVVGDSFTFIATKTNQDNTPNSSAAVNWSSSNTNVGTIDSNGAFRALAVGTTTITATSGSLKGTATVVVTMSQPISNIIVNPGFESGTTSWTFYTNGLGTFSALSPGYKGNNAAVLALNSIGSNTQLYQKWIALEPDTYYRLSFSAYSSTGNDIGVNLIQHVSPYTNYGLSYTADLGTNWQTYTTEFNTIGLTDNVTNARLMFWLPGFAKDGDKYYIDEIRLEKAIVSSNLADLNNDGVVDINDLLIIFLHFNENLTSPRPNYDVNTDGNVDVYDMVMISKSI